MTKLDLINEIRSISDHLKGRQEQRILKAMQANLSGKAHAFVTEVLRNDYDVDEANNYEASYLWHSFECERCFGFELHYRTLEVILEALKEAVANDKQETLAAAKASEFAPKKKKGFGLAAVVLGASLLTGCVNVTHESISDMQDTELCEMYGYLIAKDRIKHAHRIDDEVHKRLDNGSFTLNQRQCHNLAREGARSLKEPMDIFSGSKNTSTYYIK